MGGARSTYERKRNAYNILVGKSETRRRFRTPRHRRADNTKRDLKEVEWKIVN